MLTSNTNQDQLMHLVVENGTPMVVRRVTQGQHYGRDRAIKHDETESLIEFYDARNPDHDKITGLGQFISRYYACTLLERDSGSGLLLDRGSDAWSLAIKDMQKVISWVREIESESEAVDARPRTGMSG